MNTIWFFLVVITFDLGACFLTYPLSQNLLNQIFGAINSSDATDLLSHAVDGGTCVRKCRRNEHKICHFNFTLKHYQVLSGSCSLCSAGNIDNCFSEGCVLADGIGRGYMAINFQLPGPKIQVCKDDVIVVDLYNNAEGSSTSLHWHGLRQFGTQFMDGVPYLTQCPIPFGEKFRYSFYAADEGTHFYHSHAGHQKIDGVHGALIVRGVEEDNPNAKFYDHDLPEHTILMADWMHKSAEDAMPGLAKRSSLSQSVLVNGHGRYFNRTTNTSSFAPLSIFHVQSGQKYRFRLINAGLNVCPFLFQIEDHNFTIIATEVSYVQPFTIDTLYFLSGERYDFVIDTNNRPIRDYWLRFRQLSPCQQKLEGFAILRYHEKRNKEYETVEFNKRKPPIFEEGYKNGTVLNSPMMKDNFLPITSLQDYRHDPELTDRPADKTSYIVFDTPEVANSEIYNKVFLRRFTFTTNEDGRSFLGSANNISFVYPSFPLLLEPELVNDEMFCDGDNVRKGQCTKLGLNKVCRCTHRIKFKLGSIAELIVVNVADKIAHPMHLHGHKFHVVDTGLLPEGISIDDIKAGALPKRAHKKPPYKDTVVLPYPGYLRLRFRANNPGYWLFHCHYDWHLPIGMAVMIQVGEVEQMRKPPKDFPRCHNYQPPSIV